MKRILFIIIAVLILFAAFCLFFFLTAEQKESINIVKINSAEIKVDIARTAEEQFMGLSGRKNLCPSCGMFFIFRNKDEKTFVMRGMMFPLDIIWINDKKIVKIDRNLQPENSLNLTNYKSGEPVDYVLEVNADFCERNNIKEGDEIKYLKI